MKKLKITAAIDADEFMKQFDQLTEANKIKFANEYLIAYEIATEDEIDLVTEINGDKYQSYCDILYVRDGYKDFDQLYDEGGQELADELGLGI